MPPGLGEGSREEGVLWRGGLESGALGSCELDPVKVTAAWLFMRAEHVGRRSRVLGGRGVDERGGEVRHRNGGLGEVWLKKSPRLERRY